MHLRFARHTTQLLEIEMFYTKILNFTILGRFENHNNYDGVYNGNKNQDWHLEFTTNNKEISHNFDDDDLLVFYPKTQLECNQILLNINRFNIIFHTP